MLTRKKREEIVDTRERLETKQAQAIPSAHMTLHYAQSIENPRRWQTLEDQNHQLSYTNLTLSKSKDHINFIILKDG